MGIFSLVLTCVDFDPVNFWILQKSQNGTYSELLNSTHFSNWSWPKLEML